MPAKPDFSLVKDIARRLRYRELTNFIGQQIVIHSINTIEENVLHQLLSPDRNLKLTGPQAEFIRRALGKYGLMDLTFAASASLLEETCENGIPLLKKLRFVSPHCDGLSEVPDELTMDEDDPSCLIELSESIAIGQTVIKLLLQTERIQGSGKHLIGELPDGYFPRTFVVEDACVTNADFAWFHKHFYF